MPWTEQAFEHASTLTVAALARHSDGGRRGGGGSIAVAAVELPACGQITVNSVYGLIEDSYALTSPRHTCSRISLRSSTAVAVLVSFSVGTSTAARDGDRGYPGRFSPPVGLGPAPRLRPAARTTSRWARDLRRYRKGMAYRDA